MDDERKIRSDKGKKRKAYKQEMRKFHAGQRQLKLNLLHLEELRDKESDEENERKLREILARKVVRPEDLSRIAEEKLLAARIKSAKKKEIDGFDKMSFNEQRKALRYSAREELLPKDRFCKLCNTVKHKSKQWVVYIDNVSPTICKSCLLLIKGFVLELFANCGPNIDDQNSKSWKQFLKYVSMSDVDLLHDCNNTLDTFDRESCNCLRCSAIKCKDIKGGRDVRHNDDSLSLG